MKLNSLIRYNSLKALGLFGYTFVIFLYLCRQSILQIVQINPADTDVIFLNGAVFIATVYQAGILFTSFIFIIEFLYRKYKLKDNDIKSYPVFWTIIFWIGIILALIPFLFILWLLIFYKP